MHGLPESSPSTRVWLLISECISNWYDSSSVTESPMNGVVRTRLSELEHAPNEYSALKWEGPNMTNSMNGMLNRRVPDAEKHHWRQDLQNVNLNHYKQMTYDLNAYSLGDHESAIRIDAQAFPFKGHYFPTAPQSKKVRFLAQTPWPLRTISTCRFGLWQAELSKS